MTDIKQVLQGSPYQGYLYSYPHKTSYRALPQPETLKQVWAGEDHSQLFLYIHIPFCEMRCGFCNLFTSARPKGGSEGQIVADYLSALERQAEQMHTLLPHAQFSRLALGGGTPTYLDPDDLERVFEIAHTLFGMSPSTPTSVETSPETASEERLAVLRERQVNRISIGVQSFIDQEIKAIGRAQKAVQVRQTLQRMRDCGFDSLNIDLMYGLPEQGQEQFQYSLDQALEFTPEEIYLYPLYVRPLTGVSKLGRSWDDERLALYRFGRDYLRERGYQQVSMRMFQRTQDAEVGPVYSCQEDGMIGLGPGARSYTQQLHYSSDYAVAASGVREIITDFASKSDQRFREVDYGTHLDASEQRRRYAILGLLHIAGLDLTGYETRFGTSALNDFPELTALCDAGLAQTKPKASGVGHKERVVLTDAGFERADAIGPWLHSPRVNSLMNEFELR